MASKSATTPFTYADAANLIEEGKRSTENANSTMNPFMHHDVEECESNIGFKTDIVNNSLNKLVGMPIELKYIYRVLGDSNREFYFNNWCLHSLENLKKRRENFLAQGQDRVIDFAIIYAGMGHCVVVAYDPIDQKIFYRHDGGSSGYDREFYFNKIKAYTPLNEHKKPFSHWLNEIKYPHQGPLYEVFQKDYVINWD